MRKPVVIAAAVVALVAMAGLGTAYAYFFSGLRTAPRPLELSPATASPSVSAPAATQTSLAGAWKVAGGSLARYRVNEVFAGQQSAHVAVAETTAVGGGLTVQDAAGGLQATALEFTAQLGSLQSVDQVAGFNVSQRDRIVSRSLAVDQYPSATFKAQSVALPAALTSGSTVSVTIPGELTIHGVTRPAQAAVQLRLNGSHVEAVGSTSFAMTDFGVAPPQVPITVVDPNVKVEFQVVLARG